MSSHPLNLIVRFLLEVAVLGSSSIWAWNQFVDWKGWVLAVLVPLLLATAWGVFTVPGDPSRSGSAPIPIHGMLRLLLESLFFGFAIWALYDLGWKNTGLLLGIISFLHYVVSYDRVIWLVRPK